MEQTRTKPLAEMPDVLHVKDVAALLGVSLDRTYEYIRRGDIPSVRLGWRILVPKAALQKMLDTE